jgi:hypothetical protein
MASMVVNLYVDRMATNPPVRIADVYQASDSAIYKRAARDIGLTPAEYRDFREALLDGRVVYVRLPRHIDAMAGLRRHIYVLRNVVVPAGEMGWKVALADGVQVYIPHSCGNLSVVHERHVALHKKATPFHNVVYTYPPPLPIPASVPPPEPVTFAPPPAPPVAASVPSHVNGLPFLGLLFPALASLPGGGGNHPVASAPEVPPCSAGSNTMGVCRQ